MITCTKLCMGLDIINTILVFRYDDIENTIDMCGGVTHCSNSSFKQNSEKVPVHKNEPHTGANLGETS